MLPLVVPRLRAEVPSFAVLRFVELRFVELRFVELPPLVAREPELARWAAEREHPSFHTKAAPNQRAARWVPKAAPDRKETIE